MNGDLYSDMRVADLIEQAAPMPRTGDLNIMNSYLSWPDLWVGGYNMAGAGYSI